MNIHNLWKLFPEMYEKLGDVSGLIQSVFDGSPSYIRADLENLYLNPGKMLRPAFLLLSSTAGQDSHPALLKAAASVELLHGATLIHDDVIDRAPLRRGQPTLFATGGAKKAVLVGDYLLAQSLKLASNANDSRLVQAMTEGVSRLCLSEIEQDFTQGNLLISREDYYGRIRGKTAELFALSCYAGALLGGADDSVCDEFFQIGLDFGMAFQIDDDVLDYRGKGSRMGKRTGEDLKAGIPTLPLILALEHEGPSFKRLCRSSYLPPVHGKIKKTIRSGGYDLMAVKIGEEFRQSSLTKLKGMDFSGRESFLSLFQHLENRDY